uniref:Eukaryotic translation initiation factor 5B n=1 Tax=Thelazia callipaeda TaxID=103827 RepID=A0A0N5CYN8_THECL
LHRFEDATIDAVKLSSQSDGSGSDDSSGGPVYRKNKNRAFNIFAELDDDEGSRDESDNENTDKTVVVERKPEQGKQKNKNKAHEVKGTSKEKVPIKSKDEGKGKGKKGQKVLKEYEDIDALIADIEKPKEKVTKGKKKATNIIAPSVGESQTSDDPKQSFMGDKNLVDNVAKTKEATAMVSETVAVPETAISEAVVSEAAAPATQDVLQKKKDKRKKKKAAAEKEKVAEPDSVPEENAAASENKLSNKDDDEEVVEKKKKKKGDAKKEGDKKETKRKKHVCCVSLILCCKSSFQVDLIKEILRKRQEEEERILREQKEEEERLLAIQKAKEEEERLAKEKKEREKQKKKERDERLKAEGKYMTPAQKEKLRRQQALLSNANIILPSALRREGEEEIPTKRPVYSKRKQKKGPKQEDKVFVAESVDALSQEFPLEEHPKVVKQEDQEILDSWDAINDVVDDWENIHMEEEEKHEPIPTSVNSAVQEIVTKDKVKVFEIVPAQSAILKTDQIIDAEEESSSSEESDEEEEESSDEEEENHESKEQLRERVYARLKKRREEAESKRSLDNLRSPVICVLGHVDTGKTKMLDTIRRTNIQEGEAGGITQQIGATQVPAAAIIERTRMVKDFNGNEIKIPGFLIIDTPGHESFSNLRSRGSSLCDYAILVVDIMHGLEQQTLESLKLLRKKGTPFVIALNKIDRLYEYASNPRKDVYQHLKSQPINTQLQFKELKDKIVVQFAEQGINVSLANENPDPNEYISIVPTSAFLGDGVGNLMAHIVYECQNRLAEKLAYCEELDCTVMEVKSLPGLGTTIDVILVNGSLKVGDIIVLTSTDGVIITQIRELLMPQPLKELRVKNAYEHYQMIKGAQGVKILAKNLEKALAGLSLFVANREDELLVLKYVTNQFREECEAQLSKALMAIKKKPEGVYVQSSTLGSLEALLEFLRAQKIPYSNFNIGPVHKKDVQKAAVMLERKEEYACILAFDVRVDREVEQFAANEGVRIFSADIIYHLEDSFLKYREELRMKRRRDNEHLAIFPCKLRILPQHIFNARNPIVIGVSIEAGQLKRGVPLCVPSKDSIILGNVSSIERNHEQVEIARTGEEVCIKIENTTGEAPKLYGRHFTHEDTLVSRLSRESIDVCKAHFRDDLSKADWQLAELRTNLKYLFGFFVVSFISLAASIFAKMFNCRKTLLQYLNISLRLIIATIFIYMLSVIFFQISHVPHLEKIQCTSKEVAKLRKMYDLWPPYRHFLFYFIYCSILCLTER